MSKGPQSFRQSDVTRAVKGALAAGVDEVRVEITPEDGKISVIVKRANGTTEESRGDEWGNI